MARVTMEWESRLGRRLRVRDLYILSTVVKSRSMAKAARELAMSQPSVSEAIANLEHVLGVRLLDRSPRGVEPTIYGNAVIRRSVTVFDELKQSVKDIEFLSDPTTGELSIGCPESIAATALPWIVERFASQYPRVLVNVEDVPSPSIRSLEGLRSRKYDLIFARWPIPLSRDDVVDDLNVETLFDDPLAVTAGAHSAWAGRRKVDLADLADESWILAPPQTWNYEWVAQAFAARGLGAPKVGLVTFNVHLTAHFLRKGLYLTAYPRSWARLNDFKVLPVSLPLRSWPVSIVTMKDRTQSPAVERFMDCAREAGKWIADLEKSGSSVHTNSRSKS
jgi:DNA-binding transcriptional LysR family regulator